MKRSTSAIIVLVLALHAGSVVLWARSTTASQAKDAVTGWLKADSRPLGAVLGDTVAHIMPHADGTGQIVYYVVSLDPAGFVIVSADDRVEPIIAYSESGTFDPSPANPLGALVSRDLPARIAAARGGSETEAEDQQGIRRQERWRKLVQSPRSSAGGVSLQSGDVVSDVRVAPLIQSRWSQSSACGAYCYNYYTPNHYPAGCVATAFAQIMLYHQHPTERIGVHEFVIEVDEIEEVASTRGGDGWGGPYCWDDMPVDPRSRCSELTYQNRQAIGALCYDVGIAANMSYTWSGSAAYFDPLAEALVTTFAYSNAATVMSPGAGTYFRDMVNTNLDAYLPVALGISDEEVGHAVIADGYGYIGTTLYHHLNFGWAGSNNAWYNLPDFSGVSPRFTTIDSCTYNIYVTGAGLIISGRVTDAAGRPIPGAIVSAQRAEVRAGGLYTAVTNDKGIYALAKIPGNSTYAMAVSDGGAKLASRSIEIHSNEWGVDFHVATVGRTLSEVLFVDQAAAGANDGTSWADAFVDLQDALVAADWSQDVNQIWVANGTYYPDRGTGDRTPSFVLPDAVGVYGGFSGADSEMFPGGETALDQRDFAANPTVLSGDLNADDVLAFRNNEDNSIHVVTAVDVGDQTILDGFTVTGGSADGAERNGDASGGGMFVFDSAVVIANCAFVRNAAGARGGGLFLRGDSAPQVTNCRFLDNHAALGGGIAHVGASSTIIGSVFAGNTAASAAETAGGALYAFRSPLVIVANCTLTDNDSARGGGLYLEGSTATLTNCIVWGNQAGEGPELNVVSSSTALVQYCNIDGGLSSIDVQAGCVLDWGQGNIDADPLFVDSEKHDWHISLQSPCVDAGDPYALLDWTPYDMDGQTRIMDGRIDIGADESPVGDLDAGL